MNFEKKIDTLKLKISDLENKLSELETRRRLSILERNTEEKESVRKMHIDISFELLQVKDSVRELERKRRELENNAISAAEQKEVQELQAVRDKVFRCFAPAFERIKELQGMLSG